VVLFIKNNFQMLDSSAINKWRSANRALFYEHIEKWVAFNVEKGILGSNQDIEVLVEQLKLKGFELKDYILKYMHPEEVPLRPLRILPLRIHAIRKKDWRPDFPIELKFGKKSINELVLVDSGADISVISLNLGKLLGLTLAEGEILMQVGGVGGSILSYALRQISIKIDKDEIDVPFAWLQDPKIHEMILGREVVFDKFDIEFKQADEEILFKKRPIIS
jgi:Aspartyl protease